MSNNNINIVNNLVTIIDLYYSSLFSFSNKRYKTWNNKYSYY